MRATVSNAVPDSIHSDHLHRGGCTVEMIQARRGRSRPSQLIHLNPLLGREDDPLRGYAIKVVEVQQRLSFELMYESLME